MSRGVWDVIDKVRTPVVLAAMGAYIGTGAVVMSGVILSDLMRRMVK